MHGIEVDPEDIWPCVAEESYGNVCFAVLMYVVSDVMHPQGQKNTQHTTIYTTM